MWQTQSAMHQKKAVEGGVCGSLSLCWSCVPRSTSVRRGRSLLADVDRCTQLQHKENEPKAEKHTQPWTGRQVLIHCSNRKGSEGGTTKTGTGTRCHNQLHNVYSHLAFESPIWLEKESIDSLAYMNLIQCEIRATHLGVDDGFHSHDVDGDEHAHHGDQQSLGVCVDRD